MNQTQFSKYFTAVMEYHGAKQIASAQYARFQARCNELKIAEWQWKIICRKLIDNENVYEGRLPQVSRIDYWFDKLGYGKASMKEPERVDCKRCGGKGQIDIKVRVVNLNNQFNTLAGFACNCKNGERFLASDAPVKPVFEVFGDLISKHKLILDEGRLYNQQDKVVAIDVTSQGRGRWLFRGVTPDDEMPKETALTHPWQTVLERVGKIDEKITDGVTTGDVDEDALEEQEMTTPKLPF